MAATPQCWYMVIEALIDGEVFNQEEIPGEYFIDTPGATWQQNVEGRQQIVARFVREYQEKMTKFFNKDFQIEFRLAIRSKMTDNETDERGDPGADAATKTGHP